MYRRSFKTVLCGVVLGALGACGQRSAERVPKIIVDRPSDTAPMTVRAMFQDSHGYVSLSSEAIRLAVPAPRQPVAITVPGCGFAVREKDVPKGTVVLSVDENADGLGRPTLMEACRAHDMRAIAAAVEAQLNFMIERLGRIEIVDSGQAIIFATGEAAPVAAELRLPVRGKILVGDPCLVAWRPDRLDAQTPTTWLRGAPVGVSWTPIDDAQPSKLIGANAPVVNYKLGPCPALPRPAPSTNIKVVDRGGEVSTYRRPEGMLEAQHAAFRAFVSLR